MLRVTTSTAPAPGKAGRHDRILDAVLVLLAERGISGVTMRAVAREAGVALGLVGYHYTDKTGLISAALRRVAAEDLALVVPDPATGAATDPRGRLRAALRRIADRRYLTVEYLSLRMNLWALAQTHPDYAQINADAQKAYRAGLAGLIRAALPDLPRAEANRRAADIAVLQNGIWLTALLGLDRASIRRGVARCEELAFNGSARTT